MSTSSATSPPRPADEAGQAATELALVLPLLVLLLLAIVQVTLVARVQVLVVHAAREAAREAAVDPRPGAVRGAARRVAGNPDGGAASGLKVRRLDTEMSHTGGAPVIVTVRVVYRAPTDVPLIGPLLPDIEVRAKASMRQESPVELGKSPLQARNTAGVVPAGSEPTDEGAGRDPPR